MNLRIGSLAIFVIALVGVAPTAVAAQCGSASNAKTVAASIEQDMALSSQRKTKKAQKAQKAGEKSGQKNCPPEHKAQGHC